jgi:hypothetical protein
VLKGLQPADRARLRLVALDGTGFNQPRIAFGYSRHLLRVALLVLFNM